jgi:hypothetical protein
VSLSETTLFQGPRITITSKQVKVDGDVVRLADVAAFKVQSVRPYGPVHWGVAVALFVAGAVLRALVTEGGTMFLGVALEGSGAILFFCLLLLSTTKDDFVCATVGGAERLVGKRFLDVEARRIVREANEARSGAEND